MESVLTYVTWTTLGLALLGGLLSLIVLEIFRLNLSRSQYPLGPKPLPFLGNIPQFANNPMAFIRSLLKYGEMTCIYLGRSPVIVINTLQIAKEAFVQNGAVFAGRPYVPIFDWITEGYGILSVTYGNALKQQRRFAIHTLRNFGLGKKTMEERVAEEAQYLIKEMFKEEGKPFYPIHPIMNAMSNIICSIIFGDRFEYDDKRFAELLQMLNENFQLAGSFTAQIVNMAPFLKHVPGFHQKLKQNANALIGFLCEAVEEHRKTLDPENLRDFIDAYLVEMTKQESNEDSTFHEQNLVMSTNDLFLAGTDSTATTIRWGLIYMMNHPEIQGTEEGMDKYLMDAKNKGQISVVMRRCMDDRTRLPFTHATIHEIQRWANLTPLGVVHETTQPAELPGYHLPKGTQVMVNFMAIMTDREHWKYPDTFNPENFLDEKGQFCKNDAFVAFSLGPRSCLGETLAKTELFIFFTSLLQRLQFSWPPAAPPTNLDGIIGLVRSPFPFSTVCRSRETTR